MKDEQTVDEVYSILTAVDVESARLLLHQFFQERGIAGAMFFRVSDINENLLPEIITYWDYDFSGELDDSNPHEVLEHMMQQVPAWIIKWLAARKKPLWFQQYIRFIPFSGPAFLKLTGFGGNRPLADLVLTPHCLRSEKLFLVIGLHEVTTAHLSYELSKLAIAYLSRVAPEILNGEHGLKTIKNIPLSETQLQCLQWMAAGKSLKETAAIMNTSYANIRYHLEKAKRDSGYATTQQLLVHVSRSYHLSPLGPERNSEKRFII